MGKQKIKIIDEGLCSENISDDQYENEKPKKENIEVCRRWIRDWIDVRRTINKKPGYGSYGLKYFVEDMENTHEEHISNGAFIQAALDEGYKIKPFGPDSLNAYFNMNFVRLDRERKRLRDTRNEEYWKEREKESMARMSRI